MALEWVECTSASALPRAREVARQLNLNCVDTPARNTGEGLKLVVSPNGVALAFVDPRRGKPHLVDFQNQVWSDRFLNPLSRQHIFRRALGVRDQAVKVWDATAGFGQDAMLALSLGCVVTAMEKSPVVALLLSDALLRLSGEDELWRERIKNFDLKTGDSVQALANLTHDQVPDVVYLDPMFDKPKKKAKSPKEMQLLQELMGSVPTLADNENLFAAAWAKARHRVVVKTPLKAKSLHPRPSHSFCGQSIRYDVYVKA